MKAFKRAKPHCVRAIPGRCDVLNAPSPRRTTAFAVDTVILFRGFLELYTRTFFLIVSVSEALNVMRFAEALDEAEPLRFFVLPLILSFFGAGVLLKLIYANVSSNSRSKVRAIEVFSLKFATFSC
jgi:hypothetical protein